ncbi:MAG: MucR family transcriptional regulator [Alphaproteobacteria bacterium]
MIKLTARLVTDYLAGNTVAASDLPRLIRSVHQALADAGREPVAADSPAPAVSIKKSVTPGHVACLICGKRLKILRRHLSVDHGLTPDEYREKWGLPHDYPLVAPEYAEFRSAMAHKSGLGTKRNKSAADAGSPADTPPVAPGQDAPMTDEPTTRGHRYPANRWATPSGE